ncbi:pantothenate synthetase [Desulfatibacillum alkenivorans DSM 16219]|uniref:Pantothenate synthetase n=1 Tax=Desulfatibacillum alkenivorans DSM 16219 TaxID=1121393 RepID=A0A1M6DPB7_9BACT|nr:pantoate--beta-alanine ligase [Desulfatibacillum alkenivorans]SHI75096.1 pantothenate synthetase [Desulfatibacillum alkenivorans DSM 16219]
MEIISDKAAMAARSEAVRLEGKTIAFVPTMGYLHEGHLSLLKKGRSLCDYLVLSIFVNPTQFGPNEDLDAYPRDEERDQKVAREAGVDAIFMPNNEMMYGPNYQTYVALEKLPYHLCGLSRPVHFRGVATVVTKLFNIVRPHTAIFGEKDFQQLAVIRQMVKDLDFGIEIIGGPTVREPDGLAMSSRNAYLTPEQRKDAAALYKSLNQAQEMVSAGEKSAAAILEKASETILAVPGAEIDYAKLCDPATLDDVEAIAGPALMALAVKIGATRLIDNKVLEP